MSWNIEVEVDGEATFVVDKTVLDSFSGRFKNLYTRSGRRESSKVMLKDFPGGARGFELMSSFCYNNGGIHIHPSNIILLNSISLFMEMDSSPSSSSSSPNLLQQTLNHAQSIPQWPLQDLLLSLTNSQHMFSQVSSSSLLHKCIISLATKLSSLTTEASPSPSPSPSSSSSSSPHPRLSSENPKQNTPPRAFPWFEHLLVLNPLIVELLAKEMISLGFHHSTISRLLFYYNKAKSGPSSPVEKQRIVEMVIRVLDCLDRSSLSCRSLLGVLRVGFGLNIERSCRSKLEKMIGCVMDQVTLDSILLPSPVDTDLLYDVNLVLRFLKAFLLYGGDDECCSRMPLVRVKKVVNLVDMYMAEVAPDPHLKPSKFLALAVSLPDSARDSYDAVYRAIDIYLEVHSGLTGEEVRKIWSIMKWEKVSKEAVRGGGKGRKGGGGERGEVNEKLRQRLQGMQCKVMELEKVCRQMQGDMKKMIINSKTSPPPPPPPIKYQRSLPKLCS